jgi:hypothetical protein
MGCQVMNIISICDYLFVVFPAAVTKVDSNGNPWGGIAAMDKEFEEFNIWL